MLSVCGIVIAQFLRGEQRQRRFIEKNGIIRHARFLELRGQFRPNFVSLIIT